MNPILTEIQAERDAHDRRFGPQNHPDGTGTSAQKIIATLARRDCDRATQAGTLTWDLILAEEVAEALAESDPQRLREELIQVAAVAMAWVEAIDRRQT